MPIFFTGRKNDIFLIIDIIPLEYTRNKLKGGHSADAPLIDYISKNAPLHRMCSEYARDLYVELKATVGNAWKHPTVVFTTEIGEYINYGSVNDKLKAVLEANDSPIVTVHTLRHTNTSLMIIS